MKNQAIRDKYAALTVLSQRVLPSAGAINKVSTLISTRFQQPYEATERSRKKAIEDNPVPENWDRDHLPPSIAEARQRAIDALMDESQPVRKIPERLRLKSADLPKVLKREGGESNVEGLAQIRVMLGSLYVLEGDEKLDAYGDDTEGEELDAGTEPCTAAADDFAPAAAE